MIPGIRSSIVLLVCHFVFLPRVYCQHVSTRLQKGLNAAKEGNCEEALPELKAAAAANPRIETALNAIAMCETRLGHPDLATESFLRVTELMPGAWHAWNNLGANYLALGRPDRAVAALQRAVKLNRRAPSAWSNLGQALDDLGNNEEAFRAFDRARLLDGHNAQTLAIWQRVAEELATKAGDQIESKHYERARALLLETQGALERSASWNNLLGYAEFKLGHHAPALEHLQRAVHLDPDREEYVLDLGEFLLAFRADEAARQVFETGHKKMPGSRRIQFGLAVTYEVQGRESAAIELLNGLITSRPSFRPAFNALGRSYEMTGQWASMIELGKTLQTEDASSALAWYLIGAGLFGHFARDSGSLEESISALKRSLSLDSSSSQAHFVLGKAYEQQRSLKLAVSELRETVRLDPTHNRAHYVLGRVYEKLGERELAKHELAIHKNNLEHHAQDSLRLLVTESTSR